MIALDYPGFGYSSTPAVTEFDYTFEHLGGRHRRAAGDTPTPLQRTHAGDACQGGRIVRTALYEKTILDGVGDPSRVSPDAWLHAQWGMDRPGNKDIQYALHANYASTKGPGYDRDAYSGRRPFCA